MFSKKKKFSPFFLNCGTEGERPPLLYCHIQAGIHQINTGTAISKGFFIFIFIFILFYIYIYTHKNIVLNYYLCLVINRLAHIIKATPKIG